MESSIAGPGALPALQGGVSGGHKLRLLPVCAEQPHFAGAEVRHREELSVRRKHCAVSVGIFRRLRRPLRFQEKCVAGTVQGAVGIQMIQDNGSIVRDDLQGKAAVRVLSHFCHRFGVDKGAEVGDDGEFSLPVRRDIGRIRAVGGKLVQACQLPCLRVSLRGDDPSSASAGNFEWFIRELLPELKAQEKAAGGSIYDTVDRWVEEIPVTEFVPLFLPFLMASNVHPNAKACFLGMSVSHGRAHLARSIFEGITFCHKYHYERLMATRSEAPEVIRLAGGAARAKVWAQMFADVMNTPVQTLEANETGALGCAIAVAAATGTYPSLDEAIKNMTVFSEPILPDPEAVAVYEKKYRLYKKALESLDGLWDDMQALVEGK